MMQEKKKKKTTMRWWWKKTACSHSHARQLDRSMLGLHLTSTQSEVGKMDQAAKQLGPGH
jgi:hypothetical protein